MSWLSDVDLLPNLSDVLRFFVPDMKVAVIAEVPDFYQKLMLEDEGLIV